MSSTHNLLATTLALSLSVPAAHAQHECEQGPIQTCGSGGVTALPPQTDSVTTQTFPFLGTLALERYTGAKPLEGALLEIAIKTSGTAEYTNLSGMTCPSTTWVTDFSVDLSSPTDPMLCPAALPLPWSLHREGVFTDVPDGATVNEVLPIDGSCGACANGPAYRIGLITDPALLADLTGAGQVELDLTADLAAGLLGACTPGAASFDCELEVRATLQFFVCTVGCDQGPILACGPDGPIALPFEYAETENTGTSFQDSLAIDRYTGSQPLAAARFTIKLYSYGDLQYWNNSGATCPIVPWQFDTVYDVSSPTDPALCPTSLPVNLAVPRSGAFTDVPDGGLAVELISIDGMCSGCPSAMELRIGPITDPATLADLTGPGQIQFDFSVNSTVAISGCQPSQTLAQQTVNANVTVEYFVCDAPGTAACFGDGSGGTCGCSNDGAPGEGCANSTGAGSLLLGSGDASLSADTLVLEAQGTPNQPGSFFQGQVLLANPTTFGDGLRCCGVNVLRIIVVAATGNCASTNQPSGCGTQIGGLGGPISQHPGNAGLQPGDTRCYQWWYRDTQPANPCQGEYYNLSNAYLVSWGA